ncbi:hypothetical protein DFH08DRAFT_804646 [Mycena albidolilacea]|uniref:Uncharacterized protein n=1 Tax=Mycena albidolilacea TaxID=1033008 RepID=A0AAD7A9N3_9AGAR|nr:hypothetical protein DFH08DRAFT_804646 [Mycena albidolilacea]
MRYSSLQCAERWLSDYEREKTVKKKDETGKSGRTPPGSTRRGCYDARAEGPGPLWVMRRAPMGLLGSARALRRLVGVQAKRYARAFELRWGPVLKRNYNESITGTMHFNRTMRAGGPIKGNQKRNDANAEILDNAGRGQMPLARETSTIPGWNECDPIPPNRTNVEESRLESRDRSPIQLLTKDQRQGTREHPRDKYQEKEKAAKETRRRETTRKDPVPPHLLPVIHPPTSANRVRPREAQSKMIVEHAEGEVEREKQ